MSREIFSQSNSDLKDNSTKNKMIRFINEHTEQFLELSIEMIAKKVGVSVSSASRFAQKMGFKNFKELQFYVNQKNRAVGSTYAITGGTTISELVDNIKTYNIYSIIESTNILDFDAIERITKKIIKSDKVMIYGTGSSALACQELDINLKKMGINSIYESDFHKILENIVLMNNDSLVIINSKSCKNREIVFLLDHCHESNIPVALITSSVTNIIFEPDYKILFKTIDQRQRYSAISSKIAQLMISDIIFNNVAREIVNKDKVISATDNLINKWNNK
ncbi:MurR/RpiR family transcriptional regulator [[Acholeplasma] multilocale]|uniref:MurR/RpiR family transcriptional regulator n=1 Tax=[Acholeplasma] multilocale TaxID=264638 RepID=UPI00047AAB75|nr:MurR/RpiR family transcriptional regulator [[Acholeplasma] multilocale]